MVVISNPALLKPEKIAQLADTGKMLAKIADTPLDNTDTFGRWERIINNVTTLLDTAIKYKNGGQAPPENPFIGGSNLRSISSPTPAARYAAKQYAIGNAENTETPENMEKKEKMNAVINGIIKMLSEHIEKCAVENPNMTLGEALTKIDFINVTQLNVLLKMAIKR